MTALAAVRGSILLTDVPSGYLASTIRILRKIGCKIEAWDTCIRISSQQRPEPIELLKTMPYPGFPTDMQSQMMSVLCLAKGRSMIQEAIFESRYQNIPDLKRMGANIVLDEEKNRVVITGIKQFHGAVVKAHDLRGGAALVIAGIAAEGVTVIREATCIERGYEDICRDLTVLGAKIKYCSENVAV